MCENKGPSRTVEYGLSPRELECARTYGQVCKYTFDLSQYRREGSSSGAFPGPGPRQGPGKCCQDNCDQCDHILGRLQVNIFPRILSYLLYSLKIFPRSVSKHYYILSNSSLRYTFKPF